MLFLSVLSILLLLGEKKKDYSGVTEKFNLAEVLFPLCLPNFQGRKCDWLSWGEPLEVRQSIKAVTMN